MTVVLPRVTFTDVLYQVIPTGILFGHLGRGDGVVRSPNYQQRHRYTVFRREQHVQSVTDKYKQAHLQAIPGLRLP